MARAAVLFALGKKFPAIEAAMKLNRRTLATWKNHWREHWEMACHSAEAQLVKMVKAQIGTAAILDDVDNYLERAKRADQIATILPEPQKPTLCTFFESYVLPTCLYDDKPRTVVTYRNALELWRFITGDPPIEEITSETLRLFREALSKRRGKLPYMKAATNTVIGRLKAVQTILDKAGPPGPRNRDAAGLIASPPWIRPPRFELKLPRTLAPEVLKLVYDATAGMDWPDVPGIKAPAWWKALLTVTYNTALRRRTLFEMGMDEIDWQKNSICLSAQRFKSGRPMIVHLNPPAMEALRRIRTNRKLIFPIDAQETPFNGYWTPFHKHFHRLQDSAGIPKKEHFGLHVIRKTSATVLAAFSPRIAQLALGHAALSTTLDSYIDPTGIIGASLDAMPQPFGVATVAQT
jgi:integrase